MSLQYLLDGYNIINQMPELAQKKLEDGRKGLISLVERSRPQGSLRNKVTVVFDGKSGIWGSEHIGRVKVVFTKDISADDKIESIVIAAKNKKQIVVVTDDRGIKYKVRPLGASVVSVKEFVSKMRLDGKMTGKRISADPGGAGRGGAKRISKTVEHKINSEFRDIWLKKKDK